MKRKPAPAPRRTIKGIGELVELANKRKSVHVGGKVNRRMAASFILRGQTIWVWNSIKAGIVTA